MSFPRYAEYKDSGVEWLGEVPYSWSTKRLRFVGQLNPSKSETAKLPRDTEVSFVPMEAVGDDGSLVLDRTRPLGEVETGYTYFRDGDVTVAKITPCFENGKGAVMRGLLGGIGFGTTELTVVRPHPDRCQPNYLQWLFMSAPFRARGEASMYGAGGQKRVPDDFIRDFAIAFPDLAEQTTIAAFLDRETGKIDALVAEQEKLIALLKEKRQAVISHVVTKGLNPDAPMKPSGIEWLGDVPAHWSRPMKMMETAAGQRNSFVNGPFGSDLLAEELTSEGVPVVYIRDLKSSGYRRVSEVCVTPEKAIELGFCNVQPWDVLIAKVGDPPGFSCVYPEGEPDGIVTQDVIRFRANKDLVTPAYLAFWMNSDIGRVSIDMISVEATRTRIGLGDLKAVRLVLPPIAEQSEIAINLAKASCRSDELIGEAERTITLLKERRSALISAAVTGQIDVRGLASLPAEAA